MAKRSKLRIDTRGPLQKVLDAERGPVVDKDGVAAYQDNAPLVNEFTARHGEYRPRGKYNGASAMYENVGATPIARWRSGGMVSDSQQAAFDHCIGLWECLGTSAGLVANLDRTIFGCPGDGNPREVDARKQLTELKDHVGAKYWSIFEMVVRFDEPAGVAGSRLESTTRNREVAARNCVLFVADIIAMRARLSY